MITPLQLVSLTDFILAIECLFLAGLLFGSNQSKNIRLTNLSFFLFFAGLAAFMGGVDHGFYQTINMRYYPRTFTYVAVAFSTFYLFKYTMLTFFNSTYHKAIEIVIYVQLVAFIISSFLYHNFLLVIGNYAPVLLLFFVMNIINRKKDTTNNYLILFCITMFVATFIQMSGIQLSALINSDSLFHFTAMLGYVFFYLGAKKMKDLG